MINFACIVLVAAFLFLAFREVVKSWPEHSRNCDCITCFTLNVERARRIAEDEEARR